MSSRTKAIVASRAQLSAKLSGACLPVLASLDELDALASKTHGLFVRHSKGVQADRQRRSVDYESGLALPGLSVNPLNPEPWWTRNRKDWLARQLCRYVHLQDHADDERYAWVLTGDVVGRGPDNEPLLDALVPLGRLGERPLEEAKARSVDEFDRG